MSDNFDPIIPLTLILSKDKIRAEVVIHTSNNTPSPSQAPKGWLGRVILYYYYYPSSSPCLCFFII
jgi:hypothetical protein